MSRKQRQYEHAHTRVFEATAAFYLAVLNLLAWNGLRSRSGLPPLDPEMAETRAAAALATDRAAHGSGLPASETSGLADLYRELIRFLEQQPDLGLSRHFDAEAKAEANSADIEPLQAAIHRRIAVWAVPPAWKRLGQEDSRHLRGEFEVVILGQVIGFTESLSAEDEASLPPLSALPEEAVLRLHQALADFSWGRELELPAEIRARISPETAEAAPS